MRPVPKAAKHPHSKFETLGRGLVISSCILALSNVRELRLLPEERNPDLGLRVILYI